MTGMTLVSSSHPIPWPTSRKRGQTVIRDQSLYTKPMCHPQTPNLSQTAQVRQHLYQTECPIPHKPHPLKKCKRFRHMLLDDRKKFLKENSICFRCCGSTTHQAKDCDVSIKCSECSSDRYLAALHPGPPLQPSQPASSQDGGE